MEIFDIPFEDELKDNYLTYAMSVIIGRAIPDVRDGLKPVHRRIIYSMYNSGLRSNQKTRKSAKVVGEVLGNFHPHGDSPVYEAIVRMAQEFSLRYPLIIGQGNFGSIDGDPPAAMRYTECKLSKLAEELVKDIEKDTVDFIPNYDNTTTEPIVLPAGYPNILVNGAVGIAVGVSTSIPPHNIAEVVRGIKAYIDNPDISIDAIVDKYIKAPDFPTGGYIVGYDNIKKIYKTGKGSFRIRGKVAVEDRDDKLSIVITEIPYGIKKSDLILKIKELLEEEKIKGVAYLRDESNKEGIRVVLGLKKGAIPNIIINQLYHHTPLEITFNVNMLAILNKKPILFNLKDIIREFVGFRKEIIIRRSRHDLGVAEARLHIVEGLLKAIDNLDEVIKIIRGSKTVKDAKDNLIDRFGLSDTQSQAILDLRLQKLTAMERLSLENEYNDLVKEINYLKEVLSSDKLQYKIIKDELTYIEENYQDERKTKILHNVENIEEEDLIKPEDCVVIISKSGMIKRMSLNLFRAQRRGGTGKSGAKTSSDDFIKHFIITNTHNYIMFFTNLGKVYYMKVYEIPDASTVSRGISVKTQLGLSDREEIQSYLETKEFSDKEYVMLATKFGKVKKTSLDEFINAKKRGIVAITLQDGDELVAAIKTDNKSEVFIATSMGKGLRFSEEEVRSMGRSAAGVTGMRLKNNDYVIGMISVEKDKSILAVTERGFGKRVSFDEFSSHGRGTGGQIYYSISDKTGRVISIISCKEDTELMIVTRSGMIIRVETKEIRIMGRNTMGNRIIRLKEDDMVTDIDVID